MSVITKLAILVLLISALAVFGIDAISQLKTRSMLSASFQESPKSIFDIKVDKL